MRLQDALTTVQNMLVALAQTLIAVAFLAAVLVCGGCMTKQELRPPHVIVAPYAPTFGGGDVLWAVAPLANESGTSRVDTARVADHLAARITEVRGLAAVPVDRTIVAMASLGLDQISSPQEADAVAAALGVDGILLGSVTAYDPYDPPTLGLTLVLHQRGTGAMSVGGLDARALETAFTDAEVAPGHSAPAAAVHLMLSGANHEVQMDIRHFATGRHDEASAMGWRRFMASMELYTEFASYQAIRRLLEQEQIRAGRLVRAAHESTG